MKLITFKLDCCLFGGLLISSLFWWVIRFPDNLYHNELVSEDVHVNIERSTSVSQDL